jgi:hypothetical protein
MSHTYRKLFLCLALAVGGCDCDDDDPQDKVVTRVDPEVDFSEFHTFKIGTIDSVPLADAGIDPDQIPDEVLLNIDTANDQARIELEERGLIEVAADEEADLVVASLATVREDGGYYWDCVPGQWWGWWGWVWDPCAWLVPVYVEYTVGTIAVALADPVAEGVPFGGILSGVADGSGNTEERIRDGVTRMFEDYPETSHDEHEE